MGEGIMRLMMDDYVVSAGAYLGFEKGGCLRTVVVSIYRALNFFCDDLAH